jgi:murein DD-endopeptidase MepM/ murein hydrolase activator NlpD
MRIVLGLAALAACGPQLPPPDYAQGTVVEDRAAPVEPPSLGRLDDQLVDFAFDGGQLEFELYRGTNGKIRQLARSRYTVPVVIHWTLSDLENVEPMTPLDGVAVLPPASRPFGVGEQVMLAELDQIDPTRHYHRELNFRARFGDPRVTPTEYVYALPYPHGLTFSVLQGFGGAFSHTGSNQFAIDFDCPVATPVLAARPGVVVAANATAQGAGTTAEFLDYRRTNFVLVRHDDGTLGEYMHLAPSGIKVKPGEQVKRGQELALSGNTGFSSTPHLHFMVMTAGPDGVTAVSFPFRFAVAPKRVEAPVQGHHYAAWE